MVPKINPVSMLYIEHKFKNDDDLKFQIDIQVSSKQMLVIKVYKGDKAEDLIQNLKN